MNQLTPNICMTKKPSELDVGQLRGCINGLVFNKKWMDELNADDNEQLNIIVLRSKAKHFEFLEGFTKWKSIGSWRNVDELGNVVESYPDEKNVCLEMEFKDRKDEKVGKKLMDLFKEYNRKVVKEDVLYTFTQDIEESSL